MFNNLIVCVCIIHGIARQANFCSNNFKTWDIAYDATIELIFISYYYCLGFIYIGSVNRYYIISTYNY